MGPLKKLGQCGGIPYGVGWTLLERAVGTVAELVRRGMLQGTREKWRSSDSRACVSDIIWFPLN